MAQAPFSTAAGRLSVQQEQAAQFPTAQFAEADGVRPQWRGVDFDKLSIKIGTVEHDVIYVLFAAG